MQKLGDFKLPQFFNYPPYFTYSSNLFACSVAREITTEILFNAIFFMSFNIFLGLL